MVKTLQNTEEERILRHFHQSLNQDHFYHANLFIGPDLLFLNHLIQEVAALLLCQEPDKFWSQTCAACRKVQERIHPDLWFPENPTLAIADIRQISSAVMLKPWEGKRKVFLLPAIHEMTIEAANALLKTLEEPPKHTVFLLTAENSQRVPSTILSRCQIFRLGGEGITGTVSKIARENNLSEEELTVAAYLSDGNAILAQEVIAKYWKMRPVLLEILIQRKDPLALAGNITNFCRSGEEGRRNSFVLITYVASLVRDVIFIQMGAAEQVMNRDFLPELQQAAPCHSLSRWENFLQFLLKTQKMVRSNVTLSLVWENICLYLRVR